MYIGTKLTAAKADIFTNINLPPPDDHGRRIPLSNIYHVYYHQCGYIQLCWRAFLLFGVLICCLNEFELQKPFVRVDLCVDGAVFLPLFFLLC